MPGPLHWSCRCGSVTLEIREGGGLRGVCYCSHCQAFARHLGAGADLDPAGGSDLYQTTPDLVGVLTGHDRFACLRLTSKGPLRWYTSCCRTPIANTATTRQVPFASLALAHAADRDAAGPIRARLYTDSATGPLPGKASGLGPMILGVILRGLSARLSGRHRDTPFFDADGLPYADPARLTPDERAAAYRRS